MRLHLSVLTFAALLPWPVFGQGFILPPVASGPAGTVVGHVVCSDTHLPARLARVTLVRVPLPDPLKRDEAKPPNLGTGTWQTQLDGSFTITGVTPGDYYVKAELAGYLSPMLEFTADDWNHPTEETVHRMAQALTPVTVIAGSSSQVEVSLRKGGAISGTVRYEDRMPVFNSQMTLLRHNPKGKANDYYSLEMIAGAIRTDDQGGYRFAGLPEGEYKIYAKLEIREPPPDPAWLLGRVVSVSEMVNASNQSSELNIYLDHGFRRVDGRSVKLGSGEVSNGNDIEIRISKLHTITGTVIDAVSGSVVNSARVRILWSGDDPGSDVTQIDWGDVNEDGSFHFALVPEGTYKLEVTRAKAIMHQTALVPPPPNSPEGYMQPVQSTNPVDKTSREYSDTSQPLVIIGDMSGITVKLTAKAAVAAPH